MELVTQNWMCSGCKAPIEAPSAEPRQPCPNCGSLARTTHALIEEKMTVSAYVKTHAKHREGGTKIVREVIEGDNYHRARGKWDIMRRVIDRANNWYEETFRDRHTGEIVPPQKAEPLTEHRKPKVR